MKASNTSVLGSPGTADAYSAAAAWLVRRDSGAFTADDQHALDAWLAESAAHAHAWAQVQLAWSSFDAPIGDELDELRSAALRDTAPGRRRPWASWVGGAAVAAACALVFVAFELVNGYRAAPEPPAHVGDESRPPSPLLLDEHHGRLSAMHGQNLRARLPDGSLVTLNTNSVIDFAFTGSTRAVHLIRGQAFFEVAHDSEHAFVVSARDQRITALGTSFDVYVDSDEIKVVLVDGRVAVTSAASPERAAHRPTVLSPGQELRVGPSGQVRITPVNAITKTMWRDGLIAFDDVSLADAVAEINRYSDRPVVIADESIGSLRISGVFHTDSPQRFADSAAEVLPIRVVPEAGRVVLRLRSF